MKSSKKILLTLFSIFLLGVTSHATNPLLDVDWSPPEWEADTGKTDLENLLDLLSGLEAAAAENEWLWMLELHFHSMQRLIQEYPPSEEQITGMTESYSDPERGAGLLPYTRGEREFMIAYDSQAGGVLSYVRCALPNNWDPRRRYPFHVWPRGGGATPYPDDVTNLYNNVFNGAPVIGGTPSAVYKQGYTIVPGGLGGRAYLDDDAGLDFIEGIDFFRSHFHTDPRRMYIGGFSNGGKGTYLIAVNYMEKYRWAAIGLCAANVSESHATTEYAAPLVNTPVWIACGADDGLLPRSQAVRDVLTAIGNPPGYYLERPNTDHTWLWEFQDPMYQFMRANEYVYPGGPPPIPANFRVTSVRDQGATLSWTLPEGLEEAELQLEWAIGTGNFIPFPRTYLPPGTTSYRDDKLSANTSYRFRILANDKTGDSEKSDIVEFTTGQNMEADWAGYPVEEDGHVSTGDFLGWVYPYDSDIVWIWNLNNFTYTPESQVSDEGAWLYVYRANTELLRLKGID